MEKIEIKLKECCLTCEHFDPNGIIGLTYPVYTYAEPEERVIACGHMAVCKVYLESGGRIGENGRPKSGRSLV